MEPGAGEEGGKQRGTEGAGQVGAALAPVQAQAAGGAAPLLDGRHVDAETGKNLAASLGQNKGVIAGKEVLATERGKQGDGTLPSKMIITQARGAEGGVLGAGTGAGGTDVVGEAHQGFQNLRSFRTGQAEIPAAAVFFGDEQMGCDEPGEMGAGSLRSNAGAERQFGSGKGAAVHQGRDHVGASRIPEQGGKGGDGRAFWHSSMIGEALRARKGVEAAGTV